MAGVRRSSRQYASLSPSSWPELSSRSPPRLAATPWPQPWPNFASRRVPSQSQHRICFRSAAPSTACTSTTSAPPPPHLLQQRRIATERPGSSHSAPPRLPSAASRRRNTGLHPRRLPRPLPPCRTAAAAITILHSLPTAGTLTTGSVDRHSFPPEPPSPSRSPQPCGTTEAAITILHLGAADEQVRDRKSVV